MNTIGLIFNCPDGEVQGAACPVKYLTGGLDQGVRVTENNGSQPPSEWPVYRLFWMEYFNGGTAPVAKVLRQRFLVLLLGSTWKTDDLLPWLHARDWNLAKLGIHSPALQGIGYDRLSLVGKAAWLPDMALEASGSVPVAVSLMLRGSGTLAEETEAVLRLRDGSSALVAQAEGFAMLNAFDENEPGYPEQFRRQLHLFGLYKAYELALQQATREVAAALDDKHRQRSKACSQLMQLQESLAEFDARYYFESPVEPSRHELTKCGAFFYRMSTARSQHNDLVNQIERLGNLARAELQARDEVQHKKRDRKIQWISVMITIVAVALAAGQLLGQSPEQWLEVLQQWAGVVQIK